MAVILQAHGDDEQWFSDHRDRKARIRNPVGFECAREFRSLGMHQKNRERILMWRAPGPANDGGKVPLLKIPFLLFADESIEDTDSVLIPIIEELMRDAAKKYGVKDER
jgi:hypothetical protein